MTPPKAASPPKSSPPKTVSPPKNVSPPKISPPKNASPPKNVSPPKTSPPKTASPPKNLPPKTVSPPESVSPPKRSTPRANSVSSPKRALSKESPRSSTECVSPAKKLASPPTVAPVPSRAPPGKLGSPKAAPGNSNSEDAVAVAKIREQQRDTPFRTEKLSLAAEVPEESVVSPDLEAKGDADREESNGVGDKIKIFEKAAEEAGRLSRPGSMRRPRTERLPSDELPPPPVEAIDVTSRHVPAAPRDPKIIRPEFRALTSPAEVTIRSPSLGAKAPEWFPSHGTAFRNVVATPPRDEDEDFKCKHRATRGSSYFTRGSEEIWLVKKKDIEEIEERVLDSFRRAGAVGGTLRGRRSYGRSESLQAGGAGKAQTLKRQASVACTCPHDRKPRGRVPEQSPRPRSRSHGDPTDAAVLDKYETLV